MEKSGRQRLRCDPGKYNSTVIEHPDFCVKDQKLLKLQNKHSSFTTAVIPPLQELIIMIIIKKRLHGFVAAVLQSTEEMANVYPL